MYKLVKLSTIANISTGFPFKGEKYSNQGIRVVRGENVTVGSLRWDSIKCWNQRFEQSEKYSLKDGDVVIGMDGSKVGKNRARVKKVDLPLLLAQRVALIRNNELSNQNFLYYLIRANSFEEYVERIQTGSSVPHISQKQIEEFPVPFIPIDLQKNISDILLSLDSKIELNNRINAELEAIAKTLYDYWFVQFDFPDKNGKPYKTSGGKMVWNEELKREIPEGWEVQKMAEWLDIDKSGDWGKEETEGNFTKQVICFRGADINGLNGLDELKPPIRWILEKNSFKILKSHDLIIEISGGSPTQSTGRLAFITDATIKRFEHPLICSNFCKPVSMRNKKLLYNFVYYWNSLYDNGIFFGYEGKTSGIKNLLLDSFISSYYTVVPDEKIVDQFYDIMDNIQEKKQIALAENQKLTELRDWLLPMLMNGQVKVN
jgi:type I restriction enzyme S subunit